MRKIIVQEFLDQDDVEQMIGDAIGDITKETVGLGEVDNTADVDKPVSAQQQAALDSKADAEHIHEIDEVTGLQSALDGKANAAHGHDIAEITGISDALAGKADVGHDHGNFYVKPEELAAVATTGSYNDLADQPDIPDAVDPAEFATAAQGAKADTAVQPGDLAAVATSGDYDDLSNKPEIPEQFNPIAGNNMSITGTYPDITFAATASGGGGAVDSVNGQTGAVTLDADDIDATASRVWMTPAERSKLDGVEAGAEANVQSDWNATSGDASILNKPAEFPPAPHNHDARYVQPGDLAGVATSGDYEDLDNKPAIPPQFSPIAGDNITISGTYPNMTFAATTAVDSVNGQTGEVELTAEDVGAADATHGHDGVYADIGHGHVIGDVGGLTDALAGKADVGHNHDGAYSAIGHDHDDRYVQASELADVAASGSYDDLTDTPTIPDPASFATAEQGAKADTAIQTVTAGNNVTVDDTDPQNIVISAAGDAVDSVNGQTGVVELTASDVGAATESHQHEGGGMGSIALGTEATASGDGSSAIGVNVSSGGAEAIAIGSWSNASDLGAVAIGRMSTASGNSAIAIGGQATATDAVSVGRGSWAAASQSVAIGAVSGAETPRTTVIGRDAREMQASGSDNTLIGQGAKAWNGPTFGIAIGSGAQTWQSGHAEIATKMLRLTLRDANGDDIVEASTIQLKSPDGSFWSIGVDNSGNLTVDPV